MINNLDAATKAITALNHAEGKVFGALERAYQSVKKLYADKLDRNTEVAAKRALRVAYMHGRTTCTEESAMRMINNMWKGAELGAPTYEATPNQVARKASQEKAKAIKIEAKKTAVAIPKKGSVNGGSTSAPETPSTPTRSDDWDKETHRIECAKGAQQQVIALALLITPGNTVTNEMVMLVKSLENRMRIIVEGF